MTPITIAEARLLVGRAKREYTEAQANDKAWACVADWLPDAVALICTMRNVWPAVLEEIDIHVTALEFFGRSQTIVHGDAYFAILSALKAHYAEVDAKESR